MASGLEKEMKLMIPNNYKASQLIYLEKIRCSWAWPSRRKVCNCRCRWLSGYGFRRFYPHYREASYIVKKIQVRKKPFQIGYNCLQFSCYIYFLVEAIFTVQKWMRNNRLNHVQSPARLSKIGLNFGALIKVNEDNGDDVNISNVKSDRHNKDQAWSIGRLHCCCCFFTYFWSNGVEA